MKRTRSRAIIPIKTPENKRIDKSSGSKKYARILEEERDWTEWVSASSTRNYLIKDPLLDWLGYHSTSLAFKKPQYASTVIKASSTRSDANFTEFIMAQGNEFESKVMEYLYRKHKNIIVDIGGNGSANSRSEQKFRDTIAAMNRGVPIIYSGVLHNPDNQTYGTPDLIVRSDWLQDIVRVSPIDEESKFISAPFLKDPYSDESEARPPKYHYRIVDIKFSTLYLRADGIHILNSSSFPAYKGQLYIYTLALGRVQGYVPNCAYILGRKWTFKSKGETFKSTSCVDKLGVIDYSVCGVDFEYVEKTNKAIAWIKNMRKNGADWDINNVPLCRLELYPNMSNYHDYPWHDVKKQLADDNKEITALWMCGVKNRELAIANNVYKWTDPSCTTFILGVHGPATQKVLKNILEINRDESSRKIQPLVIQNNDQNWQQRQNLEMFVDFEFINDVVSDFSKMPKVDAKAIIFMIGVGYFDIITKEWVYKEFTVDSLTPEEECKICTEFSDYVRAEADWFDCPNPLLVHWSNAENWQWENAYGKYEGIERSWIASKKTVLNQDQIETEPRWFDLLQIFRKEPVTIKGCLGFGLKEVAGKFAEYGFIKTKWDVNSSCVDGTGAMLSAFKASKDARARGIKLKDMTLIRDIAKYNEVDCKVVGEIMEYIRKEHCGTQEISRNEFSEDVVIYD